MWEIKEYDIPAETTDMRTDLFCSRNHRKFGVVGACGMTRRGEKRDA